MPGRPPLIRPALVATAVAVPVFVVLALVLNALQAADPQPPATSSAPRAELPPLDVETPPVTAAADRVCPGLMGGLPLLLGEAQARPVRSATPYAAAWGEPPIVLRCAVPRPAALAADSSLLVVNGVSWLSEPGEDATLWTSVDRAVYVEVSVPSSESGQLIAVVAEVVADRVPVLSGPSAAPTPTR